MSAQISTLAQLMELQRTSGSKFVLMLGAGASLSSGIKLTGTLMQELLDKFGADIPQEGDLADRFDVLWKRSTAEQRRLFLSPYLDHEPAKGYLKLARLIQEGYFDLAITFNYDDLLRKALQQIGFHDYHQVIRGETDPAKITQLVESPPARFTILKLHGSLFSADTFLFDRDEMLNYPPEIAELFAKLTSRNIIVCGYGFNDNCVTRAFATDGGNVFWVNPSGAPYNAKGFLHRRKSTDFVISGELGMSDAFFSALCAEVFKEVAPPGESAARSNPFKFLESFHTEDKVWFFGREALTQKALDKVIQRPGTLHLIGPSKAGKTSLARAGVLAGLDSASYEMLYRRCRANLEEQLCELVTTLLGRSVAANELGRAFEELAQAHAKHLVVVLDQFERAIKHSAGSESAAEQLATLITQLRSVAADRVTFLFIAVDDLDYYKLMARAKYFPESIEVKPLTPDEAMEVINRQASQAGLRFDADLLEELRGKFKDDLSFTLAHLQAICYLLAQRAGNARRSYASLISTELESSLDSAIRECDVMNFVEDFPAKQERKLLRMIMKIVSEPSRRTIAAHIRDRFADLLKDPEYPEPF